MKKAVLAAIFALAMIFTLSCSNGEGAAEGGSGGTETSELTGENHAAGGPDAKTETLAQSNGAGSGGSDEATGPYAAFESLDLDGEPASGDIFAGRKLTMVNVWGTRCPYCIMEMPDLAKLHSDYAEQGFGVLGIVSNVVSLDGESIEPDNLDAAREIVEATGAIYPNIVLTESVFRLFVADVGALPTTFFIDGDGNRVGKTYLGARSYDEWAKIIEALLEELG